MQVSAEKVSTVEAVALALQALGECDMFDVTCAALKLAVEAERAQGGVLSSSFVPQPAVDTEIMQRAAAQDDFTSVPPLASSNEHPSVSSFGDNVGSQLGCSVCAETKE